MKIMLSLVLAAVLLLLCPVSALAVTQEVSETVTDDTALSREVDIYHTVGNAISNDGGSQDVDVYHTVSGGYILTIPEGIVLSESQPTTATVAVGDVKVGGALSIKLSSPNYNGGWKLVARTGKTLGYSIQVGGSEVANHGAILTCPNGTRLKSVDVAFSMIETEAKSVSYADTLTFTVSVN